MSSAGRQWVALGVIAFVGTATMRPARAQGVPAAGGAPVAPAQAAPEVAPPPGAGWQAPPPYSPYAYPPGQYPPGAYPPPGYATYPQGPPTLVHRPRRGLLIGGAVTFGVSWGIAAIVSSTLLDNNSSCTGSCRDAANVFWVPIVGPIWADARDPGSDGRAFFILWSAAELAGVIMLTLGIAGHDVPLYRVADRGPTLHLTPLLARDTNGLALTARW
jgi:hypothetical protein